MTDQDLGQQSPNFFAHTLEEILAARGLGLGAIDDRTDIHREVVRRLQRSLVRPWNFHMLSPDDLDKVIKAFSLSPKEVLRLRAAVLINSILQVLINRIPLEDVLLIGMELFPMIEEAMEKASREHPGESRGLAAVR